jgi:hypothetical protein
LNRLVQPEPLLGAVGLVFSLPTTALQPRTPRPLKNVVASARQVCTSFISLDTLKLNPGMDLHETLDVGLSTEF